MSGERVLVVEDEPDIQNLVSFHLKREGFDPIRAMDGHRALELVRTESPDLVILDLMLPGLDGLQVCRRIKSEPRTKNIPVIMLTAKGEEVDRIVGFELGVEDYVVKPFSPRELMLRIKAVMKRSRRAPVPPVVWKKDGIRADLENYEFTVDGEKRELTATEFKLFAEFATNEGKVLTREHLLNSVWGHTFDGYNRTVDTHIRRLRKKLEPYQTIIETVRGIGYRLA
ncbi:MAG: response regulator [Deltaproteobacteria bacterium]|nr:response regulator [Deltaproteobacteria bacterium]